MSISSEARAPPRLGSYFSSRKAFDYRTRFISGPLKPQSWPRVSRLLRRSPSGVLGHLDHFVNALHLWCLHGLDRLCHWRAAIGHDQLLRHLALLLLLPLVMLHHNNRYFHTARRVPLKKSLPQALWARTRPRQHARPRTRTSPTPRPAPSSPRTALALPPLLSSDAEHSGGEPLLAPRLPPSARDGAMHGAEAPFATLRLLLRGLPS